MNGSPRRRGEPTHYAQRVVTPSAARAVSRREGVLNRTGSLAVLSNPNWSNLDMGYGKRDKPERESGRAGFVDARLDELRRRWENATDEREKSEVSEICFGVI